MIHKVFLILFFFRWLDIPVMEISGLVVDLMERFSYMMVSSLYIYLILTLCDKRFYLWLALCIFIKYIETLHIFFSFSLYNSSCTDCQCPSYTRRIQLFFKLLQFFQYRLYDFLFVKCCIQTVSFILC